MEYKDYYAVLGVKKDASVEEIKRVYRLLARKHHPDLHPENAKPAEAERFKEINEAYEVLSDSEKRARYDQLGSGWEPPREPAGGPGEDGAFREFRGGQGASGFSDFFEGLFGGAGRRGFGVEDAGDADASRGQDVEAELPLTLEEAVRGGEKKVSLVVPVPCAACAGTGRRGRGFCSQCGGVGEVRRERRVATRLPKHVRDGAKLMLRGQGSPGAKEPGDLFLRVKLMPHPSYKVSGDDLETSVTVMPWTAAAGGEAPVTSLDGAIRIRIPPGTHAGRPFRIPGKGLGKEDGSRGDLYAVVRIDIPERPSEKWERLCREMKEAGA